MATFGGTSFTASASDNLPSNVDVNAPELAMAVVRSTGEEIPYSVLDGMAILEGDIILGTHAEVQAFGIDALEVAPNTSLTNRSSIISLSSRFWNNGIVPYTVQAGTSAAARRAIDNAIADWETKTSIRLVQRTGQRDYVEFVGTGSGLGGLGCSSRLGRAGGRQEITFTGTGAECLVHEIGHAVGLNHETSRSDRDNFITIDFTNVAGNIASQFRQSRTSNDIGPYDLASVMHYSAFNFALDPSRPVIRARDPRIALADIGGRSVLSPTDALGVASVYGASPGPAPRPRPPAPAPTGNVAPVIEFRGLVDGGTIPASTRRIQVRAFDADAGRGNGDGIRFVRLAVRQGSSRISNTTDRSANYNFNLNLVAGETYRLIATARSTGGAGGTRSRSVITVTAR